MGQFFISSWRAGFRGRSFLSVFLVGIALVAVAYLSASFSPRQPRTVALDVGLSGLRFFLVLFVLSLVYELVGKEIDRRSVILTLSYPIHRGSYLLGRYLGIIALAAVATTILGLLLWIAVFASGAHYEQQFAVALGMPYWAAIMAVWLDSAVVAAFALLIASLSTVPLLPLLLGIVFAILGRALGSVADYLGKGADGQVDIVARYGPLIDLIRWVLPDLSRLDLRTWPLYNLPPDAMAVGYSFLMAVAYVVMMLGAATHVFSRREFS